MQPIFGVLGLQRKTYTLVSGNATARDEKLTFKRENLHFLKIILFITIGITLLLVGINLKKKNTKKENNSAYNFLIYVGCFLLLGGILIVINNPDGTRKSSTQSSEINSENDLTDKLCGKEFKSEDYQKELDMQKKYSTTLNCDGTYKSELNWNAYAKSSEEIYNTTVGTSSGNFKSFEGTWQIVKSDIPDYITRQITEYEDFESNHMQKNKTIIIKYSSNKGRNGYAYIYKSTDKNEIILTPIPSESESTSNYGEDDLEMYFGRIEE